MFATHYHELVGLAEQLPRVRNYNVAVSEEGGKINFLRKLMPGGSDRSYGIHVAQLAGLPPNIIRRAEELLLALEANRQEANWQPIRVSKETENEAKAENAELNIPTLPENPVVEELRRLQVMQLSPLDAINKLYEMQQKLRQFEAQTAQLPVIRDQFEPEI